jgi:mitogen-activated protein kinase kinase
LPEAGYSIAAKDFVHGCLNKIPKLRPTYSMLLGHAWLAGFSKPETIGEEDEENAEELMSKQTDPGLLSYATEDEEVANWVKGQLEKKKLGSLTKSAKPALHAAPLNAMPSHPKEPEVPADASE